MSRHHNDFIRAAASKGRDERGILPRIAADFAQ